MAEDKNGLIIRLFEPTGKIRTTQLSIPGLDMSFDVSLGAFEIKTLGVDLETKEIYERDLMEKKLKSQGSLFKPE
jgi:alpha-mannosidase